jgi:hypothetical protein
VNSEDIRYYVRKELQLNEVAGDLSSSEVKSVFDAFKNVFTVTGIALKSIVSALVLNVEVFFETDTKKLQSYFNNYNTRLSSITREYEAALSSANETISNFMPILFLTNPGAYAAYHIADTYSTNFSSARDFLQEVGLADSSNAWSINSLDDASQKLLNLLAGKTGTTGESDSLDKIVNKQNEIKSKLDSLFGARISEGLASSKIIRESADSAKKKMNLADSINNLLFNKIPKSTPEAFGISQESAKNALDLKRKEAESFSRILESPSKFLEKLSSAKTLEEVKEAVSLLKNTPFVIKNIESITPQFLQSSAENAIKTAKKKGKISELVKTLGLKEAPDNEEQLLSAVKSYQLKILLGQTMIKSGESLSKQIEVLRKELLERFESGSSLEMISKIAPNSELESVVKKGVEKIQNAGKRQDKQ